MFSHAPETFYQREIMYETGLSLQAVQRELRNLVELDIVKRQETKPKVYYQVNTFITSLQTLGANLWAGP